MNDKGDCRTAQATQGLLENTFYLPAYLTTYLPTHKLLQNSNSVKIFIRKKLQLWQKLKLGEN